MTNVIHLSDYRLERTMKLVRSNTELMLDLWLAKREAARRRGDLATAAELDRIRADMQRGEFDDQPPPGAA